MELGSLYDIQEELGRGTYGVVRKCVEKKSRKIVAIKEIQLDSEDEEKTANEIRVSDLYAITHTVYVLIVNSVI